MRHDLLLQAQLRGSAIVVSSFAWSVNMLSTVITKRVYVRTKTDYQLSYHYRPSSVERSCMNFTFHFVIVCRSHASQA